VPRLQRATSIQHTPDVAPWEQGEKRHMQSPVKARLTWCRPHALVPGSESCPSREAAKHRVVNVVTSPPLFDRAFGSDKNCTCYPKTLRWRRTRATFEIRDSRLHARPCYKDIKPLSCHSPDPIDSHARHWLE
jgi:hypothetical protein